MIRIFNFITGASKKDKATEEELKNGNRQWDVCERFDALKAKLNGGDPESKPTFEPKIKPT